MDLKDILSKQDAICLLELIHKSLSCTKEKELKELILDLKALIPYDYTACLLGRRDKNNVLITYDLINVTFPSEWLDYYVIKGYHHIDPIVKENFDNFTLQYWADTYKKYKPQKDFIMAAEDFGLKKGFSYGIKNYKRTQGSLFSFSGGYIERHSRYMAILQLIIPHLHQALTRILIQLDKKQAIQLTQREREVLQWLKQGKSSWDVSRILAISEDTVNFHIKNICQKLDAMNRTHAVVIAIEQGQIDIA